MRSAPCASGSALNHATTRPPANCLRRPRGMRAPEGRAKCNVSDAGKGGWHERVGAEFPGRGSSARGRDRDREGQCCGSSRHAAAAWVAYSEQRREQAFGVIAMLARVDVMIIAQVQRTARRQHKASVLRVRLPPLLFMAQQVFKTAAAASAHPCVIKKPARSGLFNVAYAFSFEALAVR